MGVDTLIEKGWTRDADGILRPPTTGKCPESGRLAPDHSGYRGPRGLINIVICWECGRELTAKIRQGMYVYPNHQRSR